MILEYDGRFANFDKVTCAFAPLASADGVQIGHLRPTPSPEPGHQPRPKEPTSSTQRSLQRLVINVNNYCNLGCVYCYAQGGDYGGPSEKLELSVGKRALERFFRLYDHIETIQFFGGEPLLNWT